MRKNYFLIANSFLLFLSLFGFSDNLIFDVKQESNSDPKFIVHGLFFLAWFLVLVVQSAFIRKKNFRKHIQLGRIAMFIGLGVILSTFYIFIAIYEGWSLMPFHVKANRILTMVFAISILLAYINRKNGVKHKRYIYVGTLYILGPVLDRVAGKIGLEGITNVALFDASIWNILFISLFIYDWQALKRIHPISWIGFIIFYSIWAICFFIL